MQSGDRRAPRVILVVRCIEHQAVADRDREGLSGTMVGAVIEGQVAQEFDPDLGRRAGQRVCDGVKGQTCRRTGQSVLQPPSNVAGRWRQFQTGDRRALRVMQVGWLIEHHVPGVSRVGGEQQGADGCGEPDQGQVGNPEKARLLCWWRAGFHCMVGHGSTPPPPPPSRSCPLRYNALGGDAIIYYPNINLL